MSLDRNWAPGTTLGIAFGSAPALTCVLAVTGGTHRLDSDLAAYAILAGLLALTACWWTAATAAIMLWLFYDGFLVGRHGMLAWHGVVDLQRLAAIVAAALGVLAVRALAGFAARMLPADLEALRRADEAQSILAQRAQASRGA